MNPDEAAELLGHAAAFDNRNPSAAAALAWASALHDVPCDADAKAAVAAYYTTAPQDPRERLWILPHHVRTLRTKLRNARLENFQYEPVGDETVDEYLARLRGQVKAIASGRMAVPAGRPALEAGQTKRLMRELEGVGRTVPDTDDEPLQAELVDTVRRTGPLGVQCPACRAEIGFPCKGPTATRKHPLGKLLAKPHAVRIRAAAGEPQQTPEQRAAEEQRIREASARYLARHTDDIPDAQIIEETAS